MQDATQTDIHKYLQGVLGNDARLRDMMPSKGEKLDDLISEIEVRADGVFLWVTLVAKRVLRDLRNGDSWDEIRQRALNMPEKVEDLFMRMLTDIYPAYLDETCRIFELIEHSIRPVVLVDLYYALKKPENAIIAPTRTVTDQEAIQISHEMERRISSRCAGLVELQPDLLCTKSVDNPGFQSKSPRSALAQRVQYLHQSVKDFIKRPAVVEWLSQRRRKTHSNVNVRLLVSRILLLKDIVPEPQLDFENLTMGINSSIYKYEDTSDSCHSRWNIKREAMIYAFRAEQETKGPQTDLLDELDRLCISEELARHEMFWRAYRRQWEHREPEEKSRAHWMKAAPTRIKRKPHWCIDRWVGIWDKQPFPIDWHDSFLSLAMTYRLSFYVEEKIKSGQFNINKPGRPWLAYAVSNEVELLSPGTAPPMNRSALKIIYMLLRMGSSPNARPLGTFELSPWADNLLYTNFDTVWSSALAGRVDVAVLRLLVQYGANIRPEVPLSRPYLDSPSSLYGGSILNYVRERRLHAMPSQIAALDLLDERLVRRGAIPRPGEISTRDVEGLRQFNSSTIRASSHLADTDDYFQLFGNVPAPPKFSPLMGSFGGLALAAGVMGCGIM
jgi:hypothetical protein